MANDDWFLRLDPYNFDTEEEYNEFYYGEEKDDTEVNKWFKRE